MYQLLNICTVMHHSAKKYIFFCSQVEMLISAVLPIMSLYRLPHGEDSDFTGVHSEHRPEYMHTLSLWIYNNVMSCISENIYMYYFTSATARLRSGSPHNALHFTSYIIRQCCLYYSGAGCLVFAWLLFTSLGGGLGMRLACVSCVCNI